MEETAQGNTGALDTPPISKPKKRSLAGKVATTILLILLTVLFAVLLVNAMLNLFMPHYYPTFGDKRFFAIVSDSMEDEIPTGSLIVTTKPVSEDEIKPGVVITFEVMNEKGEVSYLETHRVVRITESHGVKYYVTKGDHAKGEDAIMPEFAEVVGIYTGERVEKLGFVIGFLQSVNGAVFIILSLFVIVIAWIMISYINGRERRRKLENAALKKSSQALSGVNLRYDNIREITAVMDVLDMVTNDKKTAAEEKNSEERLNAFIDAETIELPQTPETAAILDSLPAPDTPLSLASALRSGATLRQAEDGQTLVLTGLSGGKSILLTPIQTPDGIILCQQGVRLRSNVAPNIEDVGAMSMPEYPEFFEGQPIKKNVEYPELPQGATAFNPEMLSPHFSAPAGGPQAVLSSPMPVAGQAAVTALGGREAVPELPSHAAAQAARDSKPASIETFSDPNNYNAKVAYAQYREVAAQLELRQVEQLSSLLDEVKPLSAEEQARIDKYRAEEKAAKKAIPKKPGKPKTEEQKAEARARAQKRKADQDAFLAALSPADRELYLSEQKLSKSRAATIRRLKKLAADRKILDQLDKK